MIDEIANQSSPGKVLEQMIKPTIFNHWYITVIKRARKQPWQVSPISLFDGLICLVDSRRAVDIFQPE